MDYVQGVLGDSPTQTAMAFSADLRSVDATLVGAER